MNTNSWEETAQRPLDAVERRHLDRGPVRSRRTVLLAIAALPVGAAGLIASAAAGTADGIQLRSLAGGIVSLMVLVTGRIIIESDRRARALRASASVLDERELAQQLSARADAYKLATLVVVLLALAAQLGLTAKSGVREVMGRAALYGMFVFGLGVMRVLPEILHLIRSPNDFPAGDDSN